MSWGTYSWLAGWARGKKEGMLSVPIRWWCVAPWSCVASTSRSQRPVLPPAQGLRVSGALDEEGYFGLGGGLFSLYRQRWRSRGCGGARSPSL